MSVTALPRLTVGHLPKLPVAVAVPSYDRVRLRTGIAHIGVGAFHRCHQAEYVDDLLCAGSDPGGIIGINIRPPALGPRLGRQGGLYTRLIRRDDRIEARVIGSILRVVDSQSSPVPALDILTDGGISAVTLTVTEKGYCHRPSTGQLDPGHPAIIHDIAFPETPHSLPGLLARALELRMMLGKSPLTLVSCDNIPSNGAILKQVVLALAMRRSTALTNWITGHCTFPGTMVDRIAPATASEDREYVRQAFGYRDDALVVCEPFRQWVIEDSFAGAVPAWDRAGALYVVDAQPFEILKMRVLNGAQTALCHLGALCGLEHSSDDMADPVLAAFVEAMLLRETLPTLPAVAGLSPARYVQQSLDRLRNTAIRHRNHQIATDGSQKIVQRLLNPISERLRRGEGVAHLSVALAGWMAYLIRAAARFGAAWVADDPYAARIAAIADRIGHDPGALVREILHLDGIFSAEFAAHADFAAGLTWALGGLLTANPHDFLRRFLRQGANTSIAASAKSEL